jgi:hypothetical protein
MKARGGQYVTDRDEKTDHVHDHVHVNVDVDVVVHVLVERVAVVREFESGLRFLVFLRAFAVRAAKQIPPDTKTRRNTNRTSVARRSHS